MKKSLRLSICLSILCLATHAQAMRWYSPSTGRWLSRDPIGEQKPQGNLYYFSLNDPINKFDPDGRETWCPYPPPGHYCDDPKAKFGQPPNVSATASCQGVQEVADAVNIFNKAMKNERCAKWFKDHGSYGMNLPINCHGKCKLPCLFGAATWTYPGIQQIGVCTDKVGSYGGPGLASLLVHEAAHQLCPPLGLGGEACANSGQEACDDAINSQ